MGLIDGFRRVFKRDSNGNYDFSKFGDVNEQLINLNGRYLEANQDHPISSLATDIIAKMVSSANFYIEDSNGNRIDSHPLLDLIEKPNLYQSRQDFLEEYVWLRTSWGWMYMYPQQQTGFGLSAIHNLTPKYISFAENFSTPILISSEEQLEKRQERFTYQDNDSRTNLNLSFNRIIPFYDTFNGSISENRYTAKSRLDSIIYPLSNIQRAFEAKNKVLQTNARDMVSSKQSGDVSSIPLNPEDKKDIEKKINHEWGITNGKTKTLISRTSLEWTPMHVVLAELGLDDSVMSDALLVINKMQVPPNLLIANSTFNNVETAEVALIQRTAQPIVNDFTNSLTNFAKSIKELSRDQKIVADFSHLPSMQLIENTRISSESIRADLLIKLRQAGVANDDALRLAGYVDVNLNTPPNE